MTPPAVSVVMRSKDAAWVIDRALAGLYSQQGQPFELLVVDSGSTDATLEIVSRHPAEVLSIAATSYYPGPVLNRAITATRADIIVFQNSDVVPLGPDALHELLQPFREPGVVATFARQVPRPEADTWVRRDYALAFPERGLAPDWLPFSLPFAAMRRSAWERHPFYEDAWGSEDTEWGTWARGVGLDVRYVPSSVVMHSHNYTLPQLYGRRFIEGEADAFIFGRRRTLRDAAAAFGRSVAADFLAHVEARDVRGLLLSPARRGAYHLGHLAGHRHGRRRIDAGDRDASVGQRVVLSRWG